MTRTITAGYAASRLIPQSRLWPAFRVALRCVDRRFHLWSEPMMEAVTDLPERWRVCVAVAADHIRNAIKSNEGKLEDTLFGTKIGLKALAPWNRL